MQVDSHQRACHVRVYYYESASLHQSCYSPTGTHEWMTWDFPGSAPPPPPGTKRDDKTCRDHPVYIKAVTVGIVRLSTPWRAKEKWLGSVWFSIATMNNMGISLAYHAVSRGPPLAVNVIHQHTHPTYRCASSNNTAIVGCFPWEKHRTNGAHEPQGGRLNVTMGLLEMRTCVCPTIPPPLPPPPPPAYQAGHLAEGEGSQSAVVTN